MDEQYLFMPILAVLYPGSFVCNVKVLLFFSMKTSGHIVQLKINSRQKILNKAILLGHIFLPKLLDGFQN